MDQDQIPQQQPSDQVPHSNDFAVRSLDDYIKEKENNPTMAAGDGAKLNGAGDNPQITYYQPPEATQTGPMFEDTNAGAQPQPEVAPAASLSREFKRNSVLALLKGEDILTARLTAGIAGAEDSTIFRNAPKDIEELVDVLEPYWDVILAAVPQWLTPVGMYVGLKATQFSKGRKIYITNKANEEALNNPETAQKVENNKDTNERTSFKLYKDGYYFGDKKGNYVKRPPNSHNPALEKPLFKDIDKILKNNDTALVLTAFKGYEKELADLGIK